MSEHTIGIVSTIIMVVMFVGIFRAIMNAPEPTGDDQHGHNDDARTEDVAGAGNGAEGTDLDRSQA